ncbi:DUF4329 domain-containing protein [Chryseobacterium luquanense]
MQVMDPGDKFKTLRDAAKDFGKEYNGLSINYNIELRTMFYKATAENGESYYSYSIPNIGSAGMAGTINPDELADVSKKGEIVADGHTHSGDTSVLQIDGKDYSENSRFSDQDISLYNNTNTETGGKKVDNGFKKPVIGYVATGDGGLREYIPGISNESNSKKKDANNQFIKNYDIPVATDLPSDPASKTLRLNKISPTHMPNKLPKGFSPDDYKKRY